MRARDKLVLTLAACLPACGTVTDPASDAAVVDAAIDAAIDAGGDPCDPSRTPEPVDDSCGLFVDATGGDDNSSAASKAEPLETLTAALARVAEGGAIYLCSGAAFNGGEV